MRVERQFVLGDGGELGGEARPAALDLHVRHDEWRLRALRVEAVPPAPDPPAARVQHVRPHQHDALPLRLRRERDAADAAAVTAAVEAPADGDRDGGEHHHEGGADGRRDDERVVVRGAGRGVEGRGRQVGGGHHGQPGAAVVDADHVTGETRVPAGVDERHVLQQQVLGVRVVNVGRLEGREDAETSVNSESNTISKQFP